MLAALDAFANELFREAPTERLDSMRGELWPFETVLMHCDLETSGATFVLGDADGIDVNACWSAGAPFGGRLCDHTRAEAAEPGTRALIVDVGPNASYVVEWTGDEWHARLDHWVDL